MNLGKSALNGEYSVPENNMLYNLHKGERVLTAREATNYNRQEKGQTQGTDGGNHYHFHAGMIATQEDIIDWIESALDRRGRTTFA